MTGSDALLIYRAAAMGLDPDRLTPDGIAGCLAGPACVAAREAAPEVRRAVGPIAWAAAWPAWRVVTIPAVMRVLLRILIELSILIFLSPHAPLILAVLRILRAFFVSSRPGGIVADTAPARSVLADFVKILDGYSRDPQTLRTIEALEKLITFKPADATGPVASALRTGPVKEPQG